MVAGSAWRRILPALYGGRPRQRVLAKGAFVGDRAETLASAMMPTPILRGAGAATWTMAGLLFGAWIIRWIDVGADSVWLDEAASWWFATRPLSQLWGDAAFWEPNPPLYYMVLKFWIALFGDSEIGIRSLSVVFNVATVGVVYGMGRRVLPGREGEWIGWCAALLVLTHPMQVRYAQEARAYALLGLAFSLVLYGLLWFFAHPDEFARSTKEFFRPARGRTAATLSVVVGSTLAFWSHSTSILLVGSVLAAGAGLLIARCRFSVSACTKVLIVGATLLLLWLPDLPYLISGMKQVNAGFWLARPDADDLMYFSDFLFGTWEIAQSDAGRIACTLIAVTMALGGTAALMRRGQKHQAILLASAAFLPVAVAFAASYLITPIFIARSMLWIEIPFLLLIACCTLWIPPQVGRIGVGLCACALLATITLLHLGRPPKESWRDVARVLIAESSADDLILVNTQYVEVPLLYYQVPEHVRARWLIVPAPFPGLRSASGYPPGFMIRGEIVPGTLLHIADAAAKVRRIWYVQRGGSNYDPVEKVLALLRTTYHDNRVRVRDRGAVLLSEFSNPQAGVKPPDSSATAVPTAIASGQSPTSHRSAVSSQAPCALCSPLQSERADRPPAGLPSEF